MQALVRYPWPGNVRELQNIIERAVILSPGSVLQVPLSDLQTVPEQSPSQASQDSVPVTLVDAEREHILAALQEAGWVLGGPKGAAARLGMKRSTLHWKMQKSASHGPSAPARCCSAHRWRQRYAFPSHLRRGLTPCKSWFLVVLRREAITRRGTARALQTRQDHHTARHKRYVMEAQKSWDSIREMNGQVRGSSTRTARTIGPD
jgi:hypothetical protein